MSRIAAIAIGRNEGDRLKRCLSSLKGHAAPIIYVDSGSTDGSAEYAHGVGVEVVDLDLSVPFTAARARNEGLARLNEVRPDWELVQFIDGDCELDAAWMPQAEAALTEDAGLALVCGRRRERFPDASLWNRLIDAEWDTPVGETRECGGDALMRRTALDDAGGYNPALIAGEEPEMCYRMRQKGWRMRRLDAEMTLHDAALTRFGQWWKRARRAGHSYAELAALHGAGREGFRKRETSRALIWGLALPLLILLALFLFGPPALGLLLIWPLQVLRLTFKGFPAREGLFLVLGKLPEAQGVLGYHIRRLTGRDQTLIEYK